MAVRFLYGIELGIRGYEELYRSSDRLNQHDGREQVGSQLKAGERFWW